MKSRNGKIIMGLLVYAVVVAVTLGFSVGGRYHGASTEKDVDATSSPSVTSQEGYSADGVTSATPFGGTNPLGTTPDSVTSPTPITGTSPYASAPPDANTGASPAPTTPTAPGAPTDSVTSPTPSSAPGTTPSPTPDEDDDDEYEVESLNLFLLLASFGLLGMAFPGYGTFNRRRRRTSRKG